MAARVNIRLMIRPSPDGVCIPPRIQLNTTWRLVLSSDNAIIINERAAFNTALTATPVNNNVAVSSEPAIRETDNTINIAASAPLKANSGSDTASGNPSGTNNATVPPIAAPPEDPNNHGSASGLRNTP